MSNWYIASEENLEALQHYGVKGMKWGKRTEGFRKGSKNGAEYGAGLNSKSIQVNPIGVKPITVKSESNKKKTGGPTYITKDKWGNTVRADSKEELDKINEQKKKDKKEELKKKFKNLTDRIKNTAKGLGK